MRQENIFAEELGWMAEAESEACGFSPFLQELADLIGTDNALKFVERYQGNQVYVPKLSRACRSARNMLIRRQFTGANHSELARRYGLTTLHIRRILSEEG